MPPLTFAFCGRVRRCLIVALEQIVVDRRRRDCSMAGGYANLVQPFDDVTNRVKPRYRRLLVSIGQKASLIAHIGAKRRSQVGPSR